MSNLEFLAPPRPFFAVMIRGWAHPAIAALVCYAPDGFWFRRLPVDRAEHYRACCGDPED